MTDMKRFVIPVIIGATGTADKRTEKIPGKNTRASIAKKLPSWEHRTY
jgi:hypothetical protein